MYEFKNPSATAFFDREHDLTMLRADDVDRVLEIFGAVVSHAEERFGVGHFIRARHDDLPGTYEFVATPDGVISIPIVRIEYVGGVCFKFTIGEQTTDENRFDEMETALFRAISKAMPVLLKWRAIEKAGLKAFAPGESAKIVQLA